MLEDRLDTLAPDYIQEHQGRTRRTLRATLQLRHIANRYVKMPREDGLTHVRFFAQR